MNDRDSELIAGMLQEQGFSLAASAEEADIVLFNTCSVRQRAEEKVWSEIGRMKELKGGLSEGRGTRDEGRKD